MNLRASILIFALIATPGATFSQHLQDHDESSANLVLQLPEDGVLCPPSTGTKLLADMRAVDPRDWNDDQSVRFTCLAANPPVLAPFGDATYYVLVSPLNYSLGDSNDVVVVPRGFDTDLASIPRALWGALPRDGKYMSAAILHDYFYWDQRCTRAEADEILKLEMEEFGVSPAAIRSVYRGVRIGGQSAWDENTKQRDLAPRIIPDSFLTEFLNSHLDGSQTWQGLQDRMKRSGIRFTLDPNNHRVGEICNRVANG